MTVDCAHCISAGGHDVPPPEPDLQVASPMGGVGHGRVVEHWVLIIAVGSGLVVVRLHKHHISSFTIIPIFIGQEEVVTNVQKVSASANWLKLIINYCDA